MKKDWISIQTDQPDFNIPCLVCNEEDINSIDIARLQSITITIDGKTFEWYEGKNGYEPVYYKITHWKYLTI